MDWTFPKRVAGVLLILGLVAGYPLAVYGSEELIVAVLVAAIVMTVNVFLGYLAIEYAFQKSTTTFFKVVFGGMGVRMALLAAVLYVCIGTFGFHAGYLVGSMGGFYVVLLALEVMFIHSKVSKKQQQ